jgi:hypothetical protein
MAILDRFAMASGTPRASVVADLVRFTLPNLAEAANLMEMANAAPRKVKQSLVDELGNATLDAMGVLHKHKERTDSIIGSMQKELQFPDKERQRLERSRAQAAGVKSRRTDPHLLTGGSKS